MWLFGPLLIQLFCKYVVTQSAADALKIAVEGSSVNEFRGFYKREHSVVRPYMAGVEIPWNLVGHTVISTHEIRLTADAKSQQGGIWNSHALWARDWELQVSFKVTGQSGQLFGDGMAIWYAQEPGLLGPVFGSKDYFRGLAVFLDTYSNHNGPHQHGHPWVSAMVSDGTLHYDHDRDGTHTQLGGEEAGCEAKFRNQDFETQVLIRYVADTLSIFVDTDGEGTWRSCLSVDNVKLPTGYYLGVSAATGELYDIHDLISFKTFQIDVDRVESRDDLQPEKIVPHADSVSAPRDHVVDPKPSRLGWFGTALLLIVAIAVVIGIVLFGVMSIKNKNQTQHKRFY
ncbi:unnamed protein product, partial [Mesorhabditis spiculigera]